MPRLMSFQMTWPQFSDGSKTVTRRSRYDAKRKLWVPGWTSLKPDDVVEGIEWTPRWAPEGRRWVCFACGWKGPTDPNAPFVVFERHSAECPRPENRPKPFYGYEIPRRLVIEGVEYRGPRRLPGTDGHRRIVSVREERLGDITAADVEREGFPGKSPEWFVEMYCAPGAVDLGRRVSRIELENLSGAAARRAGP